MIGAGFVIGFVAVEVIRRGHLTTVRERTRQFRKQLRTQNKINGILAYYDFLDTLPLKGGES